MNRFFTTLLGCAVLLTSCEQKSQLSSVQIREALVDELLGRVAKRLVKEENLQLCGFGGGTRDGVRMLALSFNCYRPMNIEEGRRLLMACVDQFISTVRAEEKITPYLIDPPFRPKNVEIRIFVTSSDRSKVGPDNLDIISAIDGIFEYEIDDPNTNLLKMVHKETYEEALQKIQHMNQNLSRL